MSGSDVLRNLGLKAARRVMTAHKPLVRLSRRNARAQEQRQILRETRQVEAEIAAVAAGSGPIIAGPWLAEVGYEVLYWVPFLRWFCDAYRIPRERLVVLSRGGLGAIYLEFAGRYVEVFEHCGPRELAQRNQSRRDADEAGGQKQSRLSVLDEELLDFARRASGVSKAQVCHPSLMFRLFRHVWHGSLPMDVFWRHTRYAMVSPSGPPPSAELPERFVAVKLYAGPALSLDPDTQDSVRALVARAAATAPVVLLENELGLDEHRDLALGNMPNVTSAAPLMTPENNLAVQIALIARAQVFLGSCGGLAWLAPFLGTPTIGVYDSDRLLTPHLSTVRQAGRGVSAAEFMPLDLRAVRWLNLATPSL